MKKIVRQKTLNEVLTEAINHYVSKGWQTGGSLLYWTKRLRRAAERQTNDKDLARKHLESVYKKLVVDGGAIKKMPFDGPKALTLKHLRPQLREELDKRIFASANLIQLNREQAIDRTLQRFQGWVSSLPPDGSDITDKRQQGMDIKKSLQQLDFERRRVAIDQGHKLANAVTTLVAMQGNPIAFRWHSNWRKPGYSYREDHKDRDEKYYIVRDSWADKRGFIKPLHGYTDGITQPAEEVFCSCYWSPVYSLKRLPAGYLTKKGEDELHRT